MAIKIRQAVESDKDTFIDFAVKLSQFSRKNHDIESKYDDYSLVVKAVRKKAENGTGIMGLFDELYIDDMARGAGLGQNLLDETMKWMKEQGINRVKLHAYSWNDNAKRLYERNGFKEYVVSYEAFI